jgi:hypothetical protein
MDTANAVSAAATAIINNENRTPCKISGYKYLLITTKFTTEAFNINSMDIKIEIRFFLVINPYTPIKNRIDVMVKIS